MERPSPARWPTRGKGQGVKDTYAELSFRGTRSHWLGARAKDLLLDAEDEHGASAASVWEIAIKASIGKLRLSHPLRDLEEWVWPPPTIPQRVRLK